MMIRPTILYCLIALLSVLALPVACTTLLFDDCEYEKQLSAYEALPQYRFEKLYWQMKELFASEAGRPISIEKIREKYPELSDLKFKHIDTFHQRIVVGGCFDNKAMIFFRGFLASDEVPGVILGHGDTLYKEIVLWQATTDSPDE